MAEPDPDPDGRTAEMGGASNGGHDGKYRCPEGLGIMTPTDTSTIDESIRCCCGRDDCVFLKHNCAVLENVEKDVHAAAKMGQALLARHEAYMASAEADRASLTDRIETLSAEKAALEAENRRTIDENRALLDQLEMLNTTVKDADVRVASLETTLRDSQLEIRRLEAATTRAVDMERHIALLEEEQRVLQNTLAGSEEEARGVMYKWRQAERGLSSLQEQLERMEKEAREEKERHVEVLGRMERQRQMEKNLNKAAGRLQGAAAAKSLGENGKMKNAGGSSVVTHFVRDLLQDNVSLQASIAELREMLGGYEQEILQLREKLEIHQPVEGDASATSTLRAELENSGVPMSPEQPPTPRMSQELHIHHHYHVSPKPEQKKPRKKGRLAISPQIFTPPQHGHPPPWVSHGSKASTSTLVSGSGPSDYRWSMFSDHTSEFAPSSVPSSPASNPRNSMFDRSILGRSSPTSPTTSVDPLSPTWRHHSKRPSDISTRSFALSLGLSSSPAQTQPPSHHHHRGPSSTHPHPLSSFVLEDDLSSPEIGQLERDPYTTDDIPDLSRTVPTTDDDTISTSSETDGSLAPSPFDPGPTRSLRHAVSHESILSLSGGLDIHTLKARPSQLSLRPLGASAAGTNVSTVTARPTLAAKDPSKRSSLVLRDNLSNVAGFGLRMPRQRSRDGKVGGESVNKTPRQGRAFGRLVSWRPWLGVTANPQVAGSPGETRSGGSENVPSPPPTASSGTSTSTAGTPTSLTPTIAVPEPSPAVAHGELIRVPSPAPLSTQIATSTSSRSSSPIGPHLGTRSPSTSSSTEIRSPSTGTNAKPTFEALRAPGINQPGSVPIPGFHEYWAMHQRRGPPSRVRPDRVDWGALREGLEE